MSPDNFVRLVCYRAIMVLFLVSIILSGCGLASTPTPEPTTITFSFPEVDNDFYEPLLPLFSEEFPLITVE